MTKCECFTIDLSVMNDDGSLHSILRFPKRNWRSMNYPAIMQADPFLFVNNGRLHLFYEEMLLGKGLGVIKTMSTEDLILWTRPTQVTHEYDRHFSYPYIFENNGVIYMLPETGADHTIRLYRAKNESLTKLEFVKIILQRDNPSEDIRFDFADSCIVYHNGLYYLFTSYCLNDNYYLELYTSKHFDCDYVIHPQSPVCISAEYGRCGGAVFRYHNKLYRPAQDCKHVYGGQLHLFEIDNLSPDSYAEHLVKRNMIDQNVPFFKDGGHHINLANFKGKTVVARDARFLTSFFCERLLQYSLRKIKAIVP